MSASSALIIGASRGLGLGLAREYLRRDWHVVGTVRTTQRTKLHDLSGDKLQLEQIDINEPAQVAALCERLQGRKFDLLFVNAGVANGPADNVGTTSLDEFTRVMVTNAFSPMRVIEACESLVTPDGVIAAMSSSLGSVASNESGGWEVYRASKAALNMLMRSYAARQQGGSRTLLLVDPGWVRTDMGGADAALDVETSTRGITDMIASQAGRPGLRYLTYQGRQLPW